MSKELKKKEESPKRMVEVHTDTCHKCDEDFEWTEIFTMCPNCLTSL